MDMSETTTERTLRRALNMGAGHTWERQHLRRRLTEALEDAPASEPAIRLEPSGVIILLWGERSMGWCPQRQRWAHHPTAPDYCCTIRPVT